MCSGYQYEIDTILLHFQKAYYWYQIILNTNHNSHVFDFKKVEIDMMHLMFCCVRPVGHKYKRINGS